MNVTDGMKHDWSNKFYKAIFAIRYKPRQTENIYTTKGMACAVNFGTTEKPSVAVVTWNGVLDADYNSGKPMTMHRFSKSHADYILNVPPQVRLSGRFSFLPVEDSESKKFMVESLDMKALSAEQQMSNHKAYCFCGTGKSADFLKMELKYDKGKKTHVVIAHKTTHDSSSFPGSPIIVDENSKKYVVGVLGQGETFFPCFLTKDDISAAKQNYKKKSGDGPHQNQEEESTDDLSAAEQNYKKKSGDGPHQNQEEESTVKVAASTRSRIGTIYWSKMAANPPNGGRPIPVAEKRDPEHAGGISLYGLPVKEETNEGGEEEGLPIPESRSATCRRLSDLPRPITHFVNRNKELSDIKEFLGERGENACECVLIHGAVGMGKTATAIKAANEIRDNTKDTAIIYVNCQYVSSLDDLAGKIFKQVYHFPLNEPVSEVKRRIISEEDLYTLLLLDNWEHLESWPASTQSEGRKDSNEAQKITNFILDIVRGSEKVKLLLTSSVLVSFQDTGEKSIRLHRFKDEDSFQLLKNIYGDQYQLEKETSDKIAQFCSGIPLALNIVASQREFPPDLVEMMTNANPKKKYEKFTRIPIANKGKKFDVFLDACFERLDPHLQDTLVSLTLFRGRFTISNVEEVFHSKEMSHQILELTKRSFLEQNIFNPTGPCWYSFLTVQKLYCLNKVQEARFRKVYGEARNMFIEYFLAFLEDNFKKFLSKNVLEAIAAFRQEEENIMQLLDWFQGNGAMEDDQKRKYIDVFNNVAELLAKMMGKKRFEVVFTKLKQKSQEMGDRVRLSECLTSLGIREVFALFLSTCLKPDKAVEKAKHYLEEAQGIQVEQEINTGNSRAQCLAKLGRILAKENKFREARDKIEQAIDIRIQHGEQDIVMLVATYNDKAVAISLEAAHQQDGAHGLLQEAIDIRERQTLSIYRRELGEHHPFTATILDSLSVNYHALGDLDRAKRYSEEALRIRQEVLEDHMDTAKSLFDLAMVYKAMKEFLEAKKHLEKCEAMQRKLLDDNAPDLERTRRELKDVNLQLNNSFTRDVK